MTLDTEAIPIISVSVKLTPAKHKLSVAKPIESQITSLDELAKWVNEEHALINDLSESVEERRQRLGQVLLKVQEHLKYKRPGFKEWVESNCTFSQRAAYYYMECVQSLHTFSEIEPKKESFHLPEPRVEIPEPVYEEPEVVQPKSLYLFWYTNNLSTCIHGSFRLMTKMTV